VTGRSSPTSSQHLKRASAHEVLTPVREASGPRFVIKSGVERAARAALDLVLRTGEPRRPACSLVGFSRLREFPVPRNDVLVTRPRREFSVSRDAILDCVRQSGAPNTSVPQIGGRGVTAKLSTSRSSLPGLTTATASPAWAKAAPPPLSC
jgi:hypothetical protein